MAAIEIRSSRPASDRRTQRTRAALLEAFRVMVLDEGFEAITPTRLAAAANVGRSTFYEHFASADEVLGVSIAGLMQPLVGAILSPRPGPEAAHILQHFWDNRRIGKALLAGGARPVVASILAEQFEAVLLARRQDPLAGAPIAPPRLAAVHLSAGTLAMLDAWLAGRAPGSAVQLAAAMHAAGYAAARALCGGTQA